MPNFGHIAAQSPYSSEEELAERRALLAGARAGDPAAIRLLWDRYRLRLVCAAPKIEALKRRDRGPPGGPSPSGVLPSNIVIGRGHSMPRIRSIKPEALQHRKVGRLSDRAFRIWVAMLTQADDEGRFVIDVDHYRILAFGFHPRVRFTDVSRGIDELLNSGLIRAYCINGTTYGDFPSWRDHQVITRPAPSAIPSYDDSMNIHEMNSECSGRKDRPDRNDRKDRSELSPSVNIPAMSHRDEFEAFWREYPNKKAKGYAHTCFLKALAKASLATILEALRVQKTWPDWTRDGGRYIPHPSTWLNQERWADVAVEVQPSPSVPPPLNPKTIWRTPEHYQHARQQGRVPPTQRISEWEQTSETPA